MSRDRACQYGSPEFGLLRLVTERGTLWPLLSGQGYSGSDGRPIRGVLPELVAGLAARKLVDVDPRNGSVGTTKAGRSLLSSETHDHIALAERYPYLVALGSPRSEHACNDLIQDYLPGRALGAPLTSNAQRKTLSGWGGGDIYHLRSLKPAGLAGESRVAGRYALAASVALIIEEYTRFDREPPAELLACAALCWAEDLIRQVPGHPLRSTGGVL